MPIIKRIPAAPAASATPRVATAGETPAIPSSLGNDTWARSWRRAWRNSWHLFNAEVPAVAASPAVAVTPRVGGAPAANHTKRIA